MKHNPLPFRKYRHSLGWHGITGVLLFSTSISFYAMELIPERSKAEKIHQASSTSQNKHTSSAQDLFISKEKTDNELEETRQIFPDQNEAVSILTKIYTMADSTNIILKQGNYQITKHKSGTLQHYEIKFPIEGDYSKIQSFTALVLNNIPAIALNKISFKRESIHKTSVQSELFFTLYIIEGS